MEALARVLYTGVTTGAIYAAVAVGFNVIYRSGRVFNIAQGELLMVATFLMLALMDAGVGPFLALLLTACAMALLGFGIERVVLRHLIGQSEMALFMATLGLLLVLHGSGQIIFGSTPQVFPDLFGSDRWRVAGVMMKQSAVIGTALIVVVIVGLSWFFRHTRAGLLMTAVAEATRSRARSGSTYSGALGSPGRWRGSSRPWPRPRS